MKKKFTFFIPFLLLGFALPTLAQTNNPARPGGANNSVQIKNNNVFSGVACTVTGSSIFGNNNAAPTCITPSVNDSTASPVTSSTYTIQCDSGTTTIDRLAPIRFQTGASAITIPLSTASGCSGLATTVMDDGAGTLTFTRTSPDTLSVFNGSTNLDSQTSFTLTNGQFATISQAAAGIWEVRISGGASGGGLTVNGSGSATNLSSSSPALPTSGAPGSQLVQFQGSGANASGYVNGFWPRPSFIGLREHASKCAYDGNDSNLNCAPQTESPSPSGTPGRNAPVAGSPESVTYTTAGTANSVAGYIGTYQTRTGTNLLFITGSSLGSTTSIRFQAGLTDSNSGTFTQTDALGSTNTAFFRYSTAASDTNFQCITANGSTQTVTNSGIAADTALHHFVILANDSVPNYVFYIDGTAVCTVTATLPAASKNMAVTKFVTSIAASAVNFTDNGFYIESDH